MALNFPSSPTNGQTYTDDTGVVWVYDGVKWDVSRGTLQKMYSGAKVTFSSNVALNSTNTAVSFTTESFDTDSYFTIASPTRISINRSAFYRINFSVYTGTTGASYYITIKKNGSSTISSVVLAPNQYTNYDEVIEFISGDYLEIIASESSSVGELVSSTVLEITRMGLFIGTGTTAASALSGAKAILTSPYSTSSTPTAIPWSSTEYNQNANPAGDLYWVVGDPTKLTIGLNGYYRVKAVLAVGSLDNYTVSLRKNNSTTLSSTTINPNSLAIIDEIFQLNQTDYLQLLVNDVGSTGQLTINTYFEIIRVGV